MREQKDRSKNLRGIQAFKNRYIVTCWTHSWDGRKWVEGSSVPNPTFKYMRRARRALLNAPSDAELFVYRKLKDRSHGSLLFIKAFRNYKNLEEQKEIII